MVKAALVFATVFFLDLTWARYTAALVVNRSWSAGAYAATIIALSGYAAINYVNDPWMLLPAMAGAFFGTVIGSRL